ncbi:MAG: hypothetical protein KY395_05080 [Actinobacteria bacterium]|nr:hypothetical protein [Actinomycetota bacterium]
MNQVNGRSSSKLARSVGLLVVLGLPLAVVSPLNPSGVPAETAATARDAATAASDEADSATPVQGLEGYSAAKPRSAGDDSSVEVRHASPSGADPVTTIVNDPRCGNGFTAIVHEGLASHYCVHTALDPLGDISQPVAQSGGTAPVCQGNGVNGPRIQLIYMYVEGQPNRSAEVVPRIANELVPRMETVFRETSKQQGREIGMRLHMPDCRLAVDTVMIDAENGAPENPGEMSARITNHLVAAGYTSSDRKYVLWFDGGNKGACGIAPAYTPILERGYNPTPLTLSNIGWQQKQLNDYTFLGAETAIIFRYGMPVLGNAPSYVPECWGQGGTGARTEIHELIHLLGAVNLSAPHSNGFAHCTDGHDIMCYGERGVSTVPRCATPVEQLDCGSDDYFNARPSAGSYLSTHWNTANSKFLGDAIVHDNVPLEIPRP